MVLVLEHPPECRQPRIKYNLIKHVTESATKPKAYERVTHHHDDETGEPRRQARSEGRDRNCFVDQYFAHHGDYTRGFMGKWDSEKIIPFDKPELIAALQDRNPGLSAIRIERRIHDWLARRMAEWTTVTVTDENGYKKKITTLRITDEYFRCYKSIGDLYLRRAWVNQQERRAQADREKRGFTRTREQRLVAHNLKGPAKPSDHEAIARINKEVADRHDRIRIAKLFDGLKNPKTRQATLRRFDKPELVGSILDRCLLNPSTGPPKPPATP